MVHRQRLGYLLDLGAAIRMQPATPAQPHESCALRRRQCRAAQAAAWLSGIDDLEAALAARSPGHRTSSRSTGTRPRPASVTAVAAHASASARTTATSAHAHAITVACRRLRGGRMPFTPPYPRRRTDRRSAAPPD